MVRFPDFTYRLPAGSRVHTVYTSFLAKGRKSAKWCHSHRLNFRALSRAVSIRQQLVKYLQRFQIPIKGCDGDDVAIRRCLVSGYFKNAAKFSADGTYRLLRENAVGRVVLAPVISHIDMLAHADTPRAPFISHVHKDTKYWLRPISRRY